MYIPRYFLEKAAAQMAGAVETNEGTLHSGEPGMFGPESSVIPRQMLETVAPIKDFVERTDEESDGFLSKMFEKYKETEEESVGRYTRGETEVPLEKQAYLSMKPVVGRIKKEVKDRKRRFGSKALAKAIQKAKASGEFNRVSLYD